MLGFQLTPTEIADSVTLKEIIRAPWVAAVANLAVGLSSTIPTTRYQETFSADPGTLLRLARG